MAPLKQEMRLMLYFCHMIYLGSDHAGHGLKQALLQHLQETGKDAQDLGNAELDPADDYPDYAFAVGEAVAKEGGSFGILACGSSHGICIAANKVKGARAISAVTRQDAIKAREHNDANILCFAGWNISKEDAIEILDDFLSTPFSGESRHARRLEKISAYESHG